MLSALFRYRWPVSIAGALLLALALGGRSVSGRTQHRSEQVARAMTGGDPTRAPAAIRRYGCAGCHTIPGIPGGDGQVGGSLADIIHRVYVGGVVTNSPDNLVRWIVIAPDIFAALGDAGHRNFRTGSARRRGLSLFALRPALWLRGVARGQGLDIGGDRVPVALRQHCGIGDDVRHRRSDTAMVWRHAGFEHFGDIFLLPVADAHWRDVWNVSDSFRVLCRRRIGFLA